MNDIEKMNKKSISHFAEDLKLGDKCFATIRHESDGSKNIHNASVIVIENDKQKRVIKAWYRPNEHSIPYNDLYMRPLKL
jgi:hypothetical protein